MFNIAKCIPKYCNNLLKYSVSKKISSLCAIKKNNVYSFNKRFKFYINQNNSQMAVSTLSALATPKPAKPPMKDFGKKGHYHLHWIADKVIELGLMIGAPLAFFTPYCAIDYLLACLIPIHIYTTLNLITTDYCTPRNLGKTVAGIFPILNLVFAIVICAGLVSFVKNDSRFATAIKQLWSLGDSNYQPPGPPPSTYSDDIQEDEEDGVDGADNTSPEDDEKKSE